MARFATMMRPLAETMAVRSIPAGPSCPAPRFFFTTATATTRPEESRTGSLA